MSLNIRACYSAISVFHFLLSLDLKKKYFGYSFENLGHTKPDLQESKPNPNWKEGNSSRSAAKESIQPDHDLRRKYTAPTVTHSNWVWVKAGYPILCKALVGKTVRTDIKELSGRRRPLFVLDLS